MEMLAQESRRHNIVALIKEYNRKFINLNFQDSSVKANWIAQLSAFCFVTTFIALVIEIISLANTNNDSERLFEGLSLVAFCIVGILKLISIRIGYKAWTDLFNKINTLESVQMKNNSSYRDVEYDTDDEDTTHYIRNSISLYTKSFEASGALLIKLYLFTVVVYVVSPIIEYAYFVVAGELSLTDWPHILPLWTKLDSDNFLLYLISILFEAITSVYCVLVHLTFDVSSIAIMSFICSQFALIREYSEKIGGRGRICDLTKERDERARLRIRTCHLYHISVLRITDGLSGLLQNIIGVYFFVATLTLCSAAVRFNGELSAMQLIALTQYIAASLVQLFIFCYYGDKLFIESSVNMGEGPFAAAFWCLSPNIRKKLLLLSVGMTKPYRLLAGPFTPLSLNSFIQIVRSTYSYYTVVREN